MSEQKPLPTQAPGMASAAGPSGGLAETAPNAQTLAPRPSQPASAVVFFEKVGKTFENGHVAIRDVTFTVQDLPERMEFVTILGPSGCGKSTVLRLIAGLAPHHPATTGAVRVYEKPVLGPGADRGMVFQDYTSFDNRTVQENVGFGLECRGVSRDERRSRARDWITKVGLDVQRDADKYPHQLSGGMRQRVAIARTLILQPRIILMDEPFGALDPAARVRMQDLLIKLSSEAQATVFFVTHSVEEAVFLGDRVLLFSPAPGTIIRDLEVPLPDFSAKEMQRHPQFAELVHELREQMESLETATHAASEARA
jgi:ABC-type nitrate/sulfonate/bicarbonate transport system ATPase subunit